MPYMQTMKTPPLGSVAAPALAGAGAPKTMYGGIASTPIARLAIAAIDANNRGKGYRDVAMMAASMDTKTQVMVADVAAAVKNKAEDMAGITPPMGFFDPWGLSTDSDEGTLLFLREAELKHGRWGMVATL